MRVLNWGAHARCSRHVRSPRRHGLTYSLPLVSASRLNPSMSLASLRLHSSCGELCRGVRRSHSPTATERPAHGRASCGYNDWRRQRVLVGKAGRGFASRTVAASLLSRRSPGDSILHGDRAPWLQLPRGNDLSRITNFDCGKSASVVISPVLAAVTRFDGS
jgi:hypothetical protein